MLSGAETFTGAGATVQDFWRFAMSDLRMNNARGYLAEFLVAQALGLRDVRRVEWDAYDLLLDERVKVEVKSSAYLQAWAQKQLSRIEFAGLRGRRFDPEHGYDPAGPQLNAHVYVFCVQTATNHETLDALDLAQWQFFVVPASALEEAHIGARVRLSVLETLVPGPTPWSELRQAVLAAAEGQRVNDQPWWDLGEV